MVTIHDGNNGHDHDKDDGDAARSHLGHNGAPYPALPRPTPFAWVGHKINQICGMVSHWIFTAPFHILVRCKVVWFKSEIPANENSGDFDGDGDGDGEDKLGKRADLKFVGTVGTGGPVKYFLAV